MTSLLQHFVLMDAGNETKNAQSLRTSSNRCSASTVMPTPEHRKYALKNMGDPEIQGIIDHYRIEGRADMERIRDSKSVALTTKEMREIARAIKRLGLNRNMTPAQFKLLDPKGTHTMSMLFQASTGQQRCD